MRDFATRGLAMRRVVFPVISFPFLVLPALSVTGMAEGSKSVFSAHSADGYSQMYYLSPVDSTVEPIATTSPMHKISAILWADGENFQFDPDEHRLRRL